MTIYGKIMMNSLLLAVGFSMNCGGYNDNLAQAQSPVLRPGKWLNGESTGRQIIMDRNRNIVETALIRRSCWLLEKSRGKCQEDIDYYYKPSHMKNVILWSVKFENSKIRLDIKDGFGKISGEVQGALFLLQGNLKIPGSTKKRSAVQARLQLLPGPGEPLIETITYSVLGVTIGTTQTYWLKEKQ